MTTTLRPRRRGPALPLREGRPVSLLRLHGAAFMGIREPIPSDTPSPMGEDEAAWVREYAWTRAMRKIDQSYPHGFYRWCACERGVCSNCVGGRHEHCQTPTPKPDREFEQITDPHGYVVAIVVHLARQRPCAWICPCDCPAPAPAAPEAQDTPPARRTPARPERFGQAALFDA